MSGSVNRVVLVGRVGKDPEVKSFPNGGKIVSFSVATSERWNDKQSGEKKERTEWTNVVVQGDGLCRVAENHIRKGSRVYVSGKLQTRKWQDQSGQDRYATEVVLDQFRGEIVLLDSKQDNEAPQRGATPAKAKPRSFAEDLDESEIPF
jgi:single-strand DNA-binding protein